MRTTEACSWVTLSPQRERVLPNMAHYRRVDITGTSTWQSKEGFVLHFGFSSLSGENQCSLRVCFFLGYHYRSPWTGSLFLYRGKPSPFLVFFWGQKQWLPPNPSSEWRKTQSWETLLLNCLVITSLSLWQSLCLFTAWEGRPMFSSDLGLWLHLFKCQSCLTCWLPRT